MSVLIKPYQIQIHFMFLLANYVTQVTILTDQGLIETNTLVPIVCQIHRNLGYV